METLSLLAVLVLTFACAPASGAAQTIDEQHVVRLTQANFSTAIAEPGKIFLVEFFAPWCGHCKTLKPEFASAATTLHASAPSVVLATVDATKEESLAKTYEVTGYPALKILRDGKVYEYDGERTAAAIVAEMEKHALPTWEPPKDEVVELTDSTFDDFVQQKLVLVEFYAPWCGHCKSLAPKYSKAARLLSGLVPLAKVDATAHPSLGERFSVTGYPTLKMFRKGVARDYKGNRDSAEDIVQEMTSFTKPAAEHIEDAVALHMRLKTSDTLVVAFLDDAPDSDVSVFEAAADGLRKEMTLAYTRHKGARTQQKAPPRSVVIFQPQKLQSPLELPRATLSLTDTIVPETIRQFITDNKYPLVGHRTHGGPSPLSHGYEERPLVVVYYDVLFTPEMIAETNHWREEVARVARKHMDIANKGLYFAVSDMEEYKSELETLGLAGTDKEIVVAAFDRGEKYVMKEDFDRESLAEFVEALLEGSLTPFIRSQRPPKKATEGGVTVVVGSTFKKIVLDSKKSVLIELYAPWCGHCKTLAPIYSRLAKSLKGVPNLAIAKMDATANDAPPAYRVEGYPTIFLATPDSKQTPLKYEGERTEKGMVEFLQKHLGITPPAPKEEL